jgi:hypothetical protein
MGQNLSAYNLGQEYMGQAAGGLANFAASGGITPGMTAAAQQQTANQVQSIFSRAKQAQAQRQRIQGGYAPGGGATARGLGRQTAASTSAAVNNLNLGLYGLQTQNQLAAMQGLGGLGGTELGISAQDLATAQKAAAQPGWFDNIMQAWAQGTQGLKNLFGGPSGAGAFYG